MDIEGIWNNPKTKTSVFMLTPERYCYFESRYTRRCIKQTSFNGWAKIAPKEFVEW